MGFDPIGRGFDSLTRRIWMCMVRFLYKVTNMLDGRIYIGVHRGELDDGYMGSGRYISNAIRKHGIENFRREVLEMFETDEEMYLRESQIVTQEFVDRSDTYNLKVGGLGGFDMINRKGLNNASNQHIMARKEYDRKYPETVWKGRRHSEASKQKISKAKKGSPGTFNGRKHTEETLKKMRKTRGAGSTNSQYGSFWITDGVSNKKCRGEIPEGWMKGRRVFA